MFLQVHTVVATSPDNAHCTLSAHRPFLLALPQVFPQLFQYLLQSPPLLQRYLASLVLVLAQVLLQLFLFSDFLARHLSKGGQYLSLIHI